jgi:Tfp pilus assembly protein PilX
MIRRLRDESGFALMGSMLVMIILMGIGLALVARSDNQQRVSGTERVKESSFNLAESALNAQALQLGRAWPTATTVTCDATTGSNAYCPVPTAVSNGSTNTAYASSCMSGTSPVWQTQVRDNGTGTYPQYWTTAVSSQPAYDANADGSVWIRAFGACGDRTQSVVALVSATSAPLTIANTVVTANWLATSNQGKKVIIDTLGSYAQPPSIQPGPAAQPSKVVLRCSPPVGTSPCANYAANTGQIQPPTVQTSTGSAPQALTASQLQALESQAASASCPLGPNGACLWTSTCPTSAAQLTSPTNGAPVVVQGPCTVNITGNNSINSATTPGVLVIENGTFSIGGTVNFYGLLYMVNKQASSGSIVNIQGNATLQGSVNIDGLGGITAGSSKTNLIYDQRAVALLRGSTGAAVNRGTIRVLPASTP